MMVLRDGLVTLLLAVSLCGCATLPPLEPRTTSTYLEHTDDTRLGRAVLALVHAHPGQSGIVPLAAGHDAFAARVALADAAERSLDVQYYIWRQDVSGSLLLQALQRAAQRGVRVRLLLDDNGSAGLDSALAALDAHPEVEVRLFNPFSHRGWRALDYLADFARLNRRMHNKSLTADNQVTIVGGRNVGDEYFDGRADVLFVDLDVLAVGAVVPDVSRDFDRYWASASAYPLRSLLPAPSSALELPAAAGEPARIYLEAVRQTRFVRDLVARRLPFEWARTQLVSDDPAKALGEARRDEILWTRLQRAMPPPQRELQLVSPYFVPSQPGAAWLTGLAQRGVRVSVLTNALEATDVPAVHAGYARWRLPLLEAGVELWELQRGKAPRAPPGLGVRGSSGSSLHAKTMVADRERLFVGSFNFDPRSARLNTEMGLVIESPALAASLAERFATQMPERAYHVRRTAAGLEWVAQTADGSQVWRQEPQAGWWRRLAVLLLGLLPIEGML